ncbi:hypothetical protein SH501x_003116 [Pirellulaceae bacterium SH501]
MRIRAPDTLASTQNEQRTAQAVVASHLRSKGRWYVIDGRAMRRIQQSLQK